VRYLKALLAQLILDRLPCAELRQHMGRCCNANGGGLLYTSISLSHLSLLMVGIRACKAMGEIRFAGSFSHDNKYHNTIIADN
jgi:hypothetical protein